jgi:hypothetical protein
MACNADENLRVYSIEYDIIQLVYTWASGKSGYLTGIAFFPNNTQNIGLFTS